MTSVQPVHITPKVVKRRHLKPTEDLTKGHGMIDTECECGLITEKNAHMLHTPDTSLHIG